jgi:hypothetical protein
MINLGSDVFECETLFLQPTWTCAKNCPGCYVKEKEHIFGSEEMSLEKWSTIFFNIFLSKKQIKTNQVTMALDTLSLEGVEVAFKMLTLAETFLSSAKNKGDTQAHMTVNCVNDLFGYKLQLNNSDCENIDLLSISNINNTSDIEKVRKIFPNAKINWNILSGSLIKKSPEDIKSILTHVDQAYLLLHKAPLGHQGHDFASWQEAMALIRKLAHEWDVGLPDESCSINPYNNKIILDGCMQDAWNHIKANKFGRSTEGCSSNVSRFQIWPDGRVTGCAYNSHQRFGKKAESMADIVDNLRDARTRYEFSDCTIPLLGRSKLVTIGKNT